MLYENLHVLNILTKGSLRDTLANREWRLVLALMVRESYKVNQWSSVFIRTVDGQCLDLPPVISGQCDAGHGGVLTMLCKYYALHSRVPVYSTPYSDC